jgi:hypothetical protein
MRTLSSFGALSFASVAATSAGVPRRSRNTLYCTRRPSLPSAFATLPRRLSSTTSYATSRVPVSKLVDVMRYVRGEHRAVLAPWTIKAEGG